MRRKEMPPLEQYLLGRLAVRLTDTQNCKTSLSYVPNMTDHTHKKKKKRALIDSTMIGLSLLSQLINASKQAYMQLENQILKITILFLATFLYHSLDMCRRINER